MCDICRRYPCDSRCPNAPEPATVYKCAYCGEPIVEGDEFVKYDDNHYHEECYADKAPALAIEVECMTCFEEVEGDDTQVGVCKFCGEPVLKSEHHYKWRKEIAKPDEDPDTVEYLYAHYECLMDNAESLLEDDASPGTAEKEEYWPDYDPYDD